ncbi:tRNA pseudouridine synthase A [Buchnera aphidicola (Thelaxes suberi)]
MKIALGIEYDGSNYCGWQTQNHTATIQLALELALSKIANHPIKVVCAGRTDAGVHSVGQIIHFITNSKRNIKSWILGANYYLPKNISVFGGCFVVNTFHARYSVITRSYQYIINNSIFRSALKNNRSYHFYHHRLDINKMNQAAVFLIGKHDFSAFRAKYCQSNNPIKIIKSISIIRKRNLVVLSIESNSFLYRMVRNITGSLIEIGSNKKSIEWIKSVLEKKNRTIAGPTVPASGLYLSYVRYPKIFNITIKNNILFI